MFQLMINGKILGIEDRPAKPGADRTALVQLEVKHWRQGQEVVSYYIIVLNKYWSERIAKLPSKIAYLTFRCSDMWITLEKDKNGHDVSFTWLKGEEYF